MADLSRYCYQPKENTMNFEHKIPVIAIVGRPNVGKSTLFNRLINKRLAITSEIAGTTRDRIYYHAELDGLPIILVDTGGLEYGQKENIEAEVKLQVKSAIDEADLILFIIDAKDGLTVEDYEAAKLLRKAQKKVILVANKGESSDMAGALGEIYKLGFGEPIVISAYHNRNVGGLVEMVVENLKEAGFNKNLENEEIDDVIDICFIGKPNVGKSSLVNAILGHKKVIVSDIPGTTRDTTDTPITWNSRKLNLIDTAGLRRRGKIEKGLEKISTFRTLEAIERSDIACLILDYKEGIKKQDQHISSYIIEAAKGLILVVNKCDLMEDRAKEEARIISVLRSRFDFLPWAPVIFVSALKGTNLNHLFELASKIMDERKRFIDEGELNEFLKEVVFKHHPPASGGRLPVFHELRQVANNPPTFAYRVNIPEAIHYSYKRYLENEIRKKYGFTGTSIKLLFKKRYLQNREEEDSSS